MVTVCVVLSFLVLTIILSLLTVSRTWETCELASNGFVTSVTYSFEVKRSEGCHVEAIAEPLESGKVGHRDENTELKVEDGLA